MNDIQCEANRPARFADRPRTRTIGRWIKEPFPALSHWLGAALSIAGTIILLRNCGPDAAARAAFAVYGGSLIFLYSASALAHTAHCSAAAGERLDRLDYTAIFLLIAGTYTPLCVVTLGRNWGGAILAAEWLLAAGGIIAVNRAGGCSARTRVILYVIMGWLAVVAAVPVAAALPAAAIAWLVAGGVAYSVGAGIYALERPRLWPGRFGSHDLWHVLVLAGSACHFAVMWWYVAPLAYRAHT